MSAETAGFIVGEESIEQMLPEMLSLFARTRASATTVERFEWLYLKNPDGASVVWGVRDAQSGELVGFTACLPRRMMIDGAPCIAWNGADFSIDSRFRTLGPALKLRRQARLGIEAGRAEFLYAHPNTRMAVVHRQVGHGPVGNMMRMARPIRIGGYLGDRLKSRRIGRVASAVVDPLYRLTHRQAWIKPRRNITFVPDIRFDSRFDELFARHVRSCRAVGVRDATYLNWRYAINPLYKTHGLLSEKNGRLEGYLLFSEDRYLIHILDLFPPGDMSLAAELMDATIRTGWKREVRGLSMVILEKSPLIEILQKRGFKPRDGESQMFTFSPPGSPHAAILCSPDSWFITHGDRDV